MSTPLLKLQGLSAGYHKPGNILFSNLNLEINAGEFVCLMGPNGIGKSTLIRTLAGLQPSLEGRVTIDNRDANAEKVAVVLTDKIQAPNMTVEELVTLGRYPYLNWSVSLSAEDRLVIERSIARVRLNDIRNKSISELSDGQLQMALIAKALAQTTPLLILDEPTAHLDLNNRIEIMRLLKQLAHYENRGVLVSTHDLDLSLQTADKVWLSDGRKNIITGIPEDLVLRGVFDEVFRFKGFELKTGKVRHEPSRKQPLRIEGEGFSLLWTRNAFERTGFKISEEASLTIKVCHQDGRIFWQWHDHHFDSIAALIRVVIGEVG